MHERGTVVAVHDGTVDVAIVARPECETCGACAEGAAGTRLLEGAVDRLGARVGDTVEVETPTRATGRARRWVYVFPVACLAAGYGAGHVAGIWLGVAPDVLGAIVGIGAGAAALGFLSRVSERLAGADEYPEVRSIHTRRR